MNRTSAKCRARFRAGSGSFRALWPFWEPVRPGGLVGFRQVGCGEPPTRSANSLQRSSSGGRVARGLADQAAATGQSNGCFAALADWRQKDRTSPTTRFGNVVVDCLLATHTRRGMQWLRNAVEGTRFEAQHDFNIVRQRPIQRHGM